MKVLLTEDDDSIAIVITAAFRAEGLNVVRCASIADRDRLLREGDFAALVTDVVLPDGDGIETLASARALRPDLPVIVLSARNTLDTAVRASDVGAFEYFPKPFDIDELARTVRAAAGSGPAEAQDIPAAEDISPDLPLVGRSAAMQAVYRMIARVLKNDLTVLVLGESGTGKELVAQAIHQLGPRRHGPFIAVNTAAIPAELIESELFGHEKGAFTGAHARHIGKFEQANGGTLFLDEIGDMPMQAQTRLLRALQSGTIRRVGGHEEVRINARIVAATNRELEPLIAAGQFREDLYYRLNVVPITLPALRDRRDDIAPLAQHFLTLAAREGLPRRQLSVDALDLLSAQGWRGNVRELRNFIYRLALLSREDRVDCAALLPLLGAAPQDQAALPAAVGAGLTPSDLAGYLGLDHAVRDWLRAEAPPEGQVYDQALAALERPLFTQVLRETGGNQLRAARILGINRNTLRKRLTDLALDPDGFTQLPVLARNER